MLNKDDISLVVLTFLFGFAFSDSDSSVTLVTLAILSLPSLEHSDGDFGWVD